MGFPVELNWVVKLATKNGLPESIEDGLEFPFQKDEYRVYPLNIPLDLINDAWEVLARGVVTECTQKKGKTFGVFKVIRVYTEEEQAFLTNYWRERVEYTNGKIEDFKGVKVS